MALAVSVDGVVYRSLAAVARVYGISPSAVVGRIASSNPEWAQWKYVEPKKAKRNWLPSSIRESVAKISAKHKPR